MTKIYLRRSRRLPISRRCRTVARIFVRHRHVRKHRGSRSSGATLATKAASCRFAMAGFSAARSYMDPAFRNALSSCATAAGRVTNACSSVSIAPRRSHVYTAAAAQLFAATASEAGADAAAAASGAAPPRSPFWPSPESRRPGRTVRTRPLRRARRARRRALDRLRGGREAHLRALHVAEDQVHAARQGKDGGIRCVRRAPTRQPVQARQRGEEVALAHVRVHRRVQRGIAATAPRAHCMRVAARARAREFSLTTLSQRVARVGRGGSVPGGAAAARAASPRLSSAAAARLGSSAWSTRSAWGWRTRLPARCCTWRRPGRRARSARPPPPRAAGAASATTWNVFRHSQAGEFVAGRAPFPPTSAGACSAAVAFSSVARHAPWRASACSACTSPSATVSGWIFATKSPAPSAAPPPGATPVVAAAPREPGARGDAAGGDAGDGSARWVRNTDTGDTSAGDTRRRRGERRRRGAGSTRSRGGDETRRGRCRGRRGHHGRRRCRTRARCARHGAGGRRGVRRRERRGERRGEREGGAATPGGGPCAVSGCTRPPARREERREAAPSAAGGDAAAPLPRSSADDPRAVGLTLPSRARAPRSEGEAGDGFFFVRSRASRGRDSRHLDFVRVIYGKGALFRARARGRVRGVERPAAARPSWRPGRPRALRARDNRDAAPRPWTS